MKFEEVLEKRRSIRKYDSKEVSPEALNTVLESIRWAPSWNNTQCWEVIVVKDPAQKEKPQGTLPKANPAWKSVMNAPVVLAICGKIGVSGYYTGQALTKFGDWYMYDLGLATQTLCLAARDQELGTVIIGTFDHDKAKEILAVPDKFELVSLVPIGYPAKISSAPSPVSTTLY